MEFTLPADLEAHEPPEARGLFRDQVRLLVARRAEEAVSHHPFTDLPKLLRPGDVLVVNTSATLPAAVPVAGGQLAAHFSTELPDGSWLVELRRLRESTTRVSGGYDSRVPGPLSSRVVSSGTASRNVGHASRKVSEPYAGAAAGERYRLFGGATLALRSPYSAGRLWVAELDTPVVPYLTRFGEPIRYSYVPQRWPLSYYQTVFGTTPGSAEMPSASRPVTDRTVTRLISAGVQFTPILLHTGVASPEAHERPYPERFSVTAHTARVVNQARAAGGRVIAVGTTAVRALETAAGEDGIVRPAAGWTELIVTPGRGVRAIDGLLTGFHEPRASHLDMLTAIAGHRLLTHTYTEALANSYLWHEFGDLNLLLP